MLLVVKCHASFSDLLGGVVAIKLEAISRRALQYLAPLQYIGFVEA
jgi:hypothetical protein